LINEDEIVEEEVRGKPRPPILPGDRAFNKHFGNCVLLFSFFLSFFISFVIGLWDTYLAPAYVDPNRKR
jgi:hypothetical protein